MKKIFISYSHKDEGWKDRVNKHLQVFQLEGSWRTWDDRQIKEGTKWEQEITDAIQSAHAVVLLITVDFLISDFIREKEVPLILQRWQKNEIIVFPVIVEPCSWQAIEWLEQMQVFPKDGVPLAKGQPVEIKENLSLLAKKVNQLLQDPVGAAAAEEIPGNTQRPFHHTSLGEMVYVFISYIHENKREVDRLCDDLRKNGIQVWLDREQIMPGHRWKYAIREAIKKGSYFIACFSHEYRHRIRSHMNEELTFAVDELRKRPTDRAWFIPVLFSGEVPDRSIGGGETLRDIQWVDLRLDWEDGIRRIINVIAPNTAEHTDIELLKKELANRDLLIKKMTAMNEVKTIGNAVESYITDNYKAPQAKTMEELKKHLEPLYITELPLKDPWGKPYQYRQSDTDESEYTITCTGSEKKIVFANGNFLENH